MAVRERLFRAMCADGRAWVYGVPVKNLMVYNTCYESKWADRFPRSGIKRETLREYTGLAGRSGTKIFADPELTAGGAE